ncbi:MAG: glycosyltransferase family 2 protein, partial [Chloroflexota bacterium]
MSKARRAALLLHTNPRLFIRRLAMYAGSPRTAVVAVGEDQERTVRARASYDRWMAGTRPSATSLTASDALLSVIMPVCDTPAQFLDDAIASVVAQTYAKWELCIADDASSLPHIREVLDRWASLDKRIRVQYRDVRGHISRASNAALDMARGDFVVLLDHDDVLLPQALMRVAEAASEPSVDFIYSDEDKLAPDGARIDPFFKPAWSPSLLLSCNYITHLAAIRRSIVVDVCGFRPGYEGSQDHDLFLRATSQSRRIAHIPDVLYSWRQSNASTALVNSAKPYAVAAARRSLEEALQRGSGLAGLEESHLYGLFLARRAVPAPASVQIMSSGDSETIQDIARVPGVIVAEQAEYLLWVQETA